MRGKRRTLGININVKTALTIMPSTIAVDCCVFDTENKNP